MIPAEFRLSVLHSGKSGSFLILVEMLPPVYTKAVLEEYRRKEAANALPFGMKQLSPASLKAACQEVRRGKYARKDEPLLKAFFGEGANEEACLKAIDACEIDRFRPLVNFLKEKTTRPDDRVVELVAWLIDFKDRPYNYIVDYAKVSGIPLGLTLEAAIEPGPDEPGASEAGSKQTASKPEKKRWESKKLILSIAVIAIFGIVIYRIRPGTPGKQPFGSVAPPAPQACMYWADDHYQPINCSQKVENVQLIALDSEKVLHFKKITRPDTITANAKGLVWYVRYRGNYEYYTDSGFHPIDPQLRLKPITDYIIGRHVPATP